MINFNQFKKFDRVKHLSEYEQQRQYWIFRNNILSPVFSKGGGGTVGGRKKPPTDIPSGFLFYTTPGQQFTTDTTDIVVKTSTGYAKAFYPYDIPTPIFGVGDESLDIQIELTDTTFWNGILPFRVRSCDIDGNLTGDIIYIKVNGISNFKSINFEDCKNDLVGIDVSGCSDLEEINISTSVSLKNINFSNCKVSEIDLNGCESLEEIDFSGNTFTSVYTLDLIQIDTLKFITGDNSNIWGLLTSTNTLETISLIDCTNLSSLSCNGFTGNGGDCTINIKNAALGGGGLDTFYTSLGIAFGIIKTIYIHGNPGVMSSDPNIAQTKGYTINQNP